MAEMHQLVVLLTANKPEKKKWSNSLFISLPMVCVCVLL